MKQYNWAGLAVAFTLLAGIATADEPAAAVDPISGSFGLGAGWTTGNTDTKSFNLSFELIHDPKTKNVFKADAMYLYGAQEGDATVDKRSVGLRDDYSFAERWAMFGELRYMADRFKQIDDLTALSVGIAWKAIVSEKVMLGFDAGCGGIWEKNEGFDREGSGLYRAGETFRWVISPTASLTQSVTGLWKSDDTSDMLVHAEVALLASIASRLELKVGVVDDYKRKPSSPELEKNDMATVVALVVKY